MDFDQNGQIIHLNQKLNVINKNFKIEKNKLLKLRKYIEKNFDFVGKDFSKKVREIYYDNNSNNNKQKNDKLKLQFKDYRNETIEWYYKLSNNKNEFSNKQSQ